jgi:hypothetical protein
MSLSLPKVLKNKYLLPLCLKTKATAPQKPKRKRSSKLRKKLSSPRIFKSNYKKTKTKTKKETKKTRKRTTKKKNFKKRALMRRMLSSKNPQNKQR